MAWKAGPRRGKAVSRPYGLYGPDSVLRRLYQGAIKEIFTRDLEEVQGHKTRVKPTTGVSTFLRKCYPDLAYNSQLPG